MIRPYGALAVVWRFGPGFASVPVVRNAIRITTIAVATLLALNLLRGEASACSCSGAPWVAWPYQTAPTDTTFIVAGLQPLADSAFVLTGPNGATVPLKPTVTVAANGPCTTVVHFVAPTETLDANSAYILTVTSPSRDSPREPVKFAFTTGVGPATPVETGAQLWLFATSLRGERILHLFADHNREHPLFINATGEHANASGILSPLLLDRGPASLAIGGVACTTVTVYDHTGRLIQSSELCNPTRCRVSTSVSQSSCDANRGYTSWQVWVDVERGCSAGTVEPEPTEGTGGMMVTGGSSGVTADGSTPNGPELQSGGCAVSSHGTDRRTSGVFWMALMGLVMLVRRFRQQ